MRKLSRSQVKTPRQRSFERNKNRSRTKSDLEQSFLKPPIISTLQKTKQQLEIARKRNEYLEKTVTNLRSGPSYAGGVSLRSENQYATPAENLQVLRERVKFLEGQNKIQVQNVESLQKILMLKEKENQKLRDDLRRADIALRTEFIKMEDFAEEIEAKYKDDFQRLETANKALLQQLFQARAKHRGDKLLFELTDDQECTGEVNTGE